MEHEPWYCEYSVEVDVRPAFAWSYWTDIGNWVDPPAQFSLDGAFAAGSQGMTQMPGHEPIEWRIAAVETGQSATIQIPLDRAVLSFHWRFEALSDRRTRITQRIELTGENADAYAEARAAFRANLRGGMERIAAAMSQAAAAV